jgi:hypothetical protein
MIHTAEDILRRFIPKDCIWEEEDNPAIGEWNLTNTPSKYVRQAINEARIELIKEIAEDYPICHVVEGQCGYSSQNVLKLLDQIK